MTDGFQAGQSIAVSGTGLVNNDASFQIASISSDGSTLVLAPGNFVASETVSGVSVGAPNIPDTITRSNGSWSSDGFQAGQSITVAGTKSNNGVFQIASISPDGTTLILVVGEAVVNETGPGSTRVTSAVEHQVPDTIKRSTGNWSTDGFRAGQSITVAGSQSNDGIYQVGSISADGSTRR